MFLPRQKWKASNIVKNETESLGPDFLALRLVIILKVIMKRLPPRIGPVLILCRLKEHRLEAEKKE